MFSKRAPLPPPGPPCLVPSRPRTDAPPADAALTPSSGRRIPLRKVFAQGPGALLLVGRGICLRRISRGSGPRMMEILSESGCTPFTFPVGARPLRCQRRFAAVPGAPAPQQSPHGAPLLQPPATRQGTPQPSVAPDVPRQPPCNPSGLRDRAAEPFWLSLSKGTGTWMA